MLWISDGISFIIYMIKVTKFRKDLTVYSQFINSIYKEVNTYTCVKRRFMIIINHIFLSKCSSVLWGSEKLISIAKTIDDQNISSLYFGALVKGLIYGNIYS